MTVCSECGAPLDPTVIHVRHFGCSSDDWDDCDCPEVCSSCCRSCRWQIENFGLPRQIATKIETDPVTGCWLWTGNISGGTGYGGINYKNRQQGAHRVVYELLVGPIPDGLELDHLCRVRRCVNPGHLEPVTHRENALRGLGPSAGNATATHCIHGHPFDADNTYVKSNGHRFCKVCARQHRLERAARLRGGPMTELTDDELAEVKAKYADADPRYSRVRTIHRLIATVEYWRDRATDPEVAS